MIKSATAAILYELNEPLKIREVLLPELKIGQVLVKIFYSGVCRSQVMECFGGRGEDKWLPHLMGHEGAGEVVNIGPDVKKVKIGDKVILGWIAGDGIEAENAKYLCGRQTINSGKVTTFSNYSVVSENRVYLKPEGISDPVAVLFGCAMPTGAGIVLNEMKPEKHHSVAVIGLGGIGMSSILALAALNVETIIAVDKSDEKLELATDIGATHTINPLRTDLFKELHGFCKNGVDFCVESAGQTQTIEAGFSILNKNKGHLFFASHPPDGETIKIAPHELISGKKITGSWGGKTKPDQDLGLLTKVIAGKNNQLLRMLPKEYTLYEINSAISDLATGRAFRPLIKMHH